MHTSERLYYSDSFLRTFSGAVTDVRELAGSNGGYGLAGVAESYCLLSDERRTAFRYGHAEGEFCLAGRCGRFPWNRWRRTRKGRCGISCANRLATGTRVEGQIDWERRFDHMQQHTGQHLLSAVFLRELQMPTVSFHLGEGSSTIDLAGGLPAHHSLERVERIANEIIFEDRPVTTSYVPRDEAEAMLAAGELRKLPDRQGTIRLIEIADCDHNACGGTHVRSTGQIGALLLRGVERVSRGVRVEFVCGLRAVRAARADFDPGQDHGTAFDRGNRTAGNGGANADRGEDKREGAPKVARGTGGYFRLRRWRRKCRSTTGCDWWCVSGRTGNRDYVRLLASRTAAAAAVNSRDLLR